VQRKVSFVAGALGTAFVTACVTINIYFPAAAAERVADRIVDEVYQLKPDTAKPKEGDAASPK
jgi:hypothetical protein